MLLWFFLALNMVIDTHIFHSSLVQTDLQGDIFMVQNLSQNVPWIEPKTFAVQQWHAL
jgi:hypothetical protein